MHTQKNSSQGETMAHGSNGQSRRQFLAVTSAAVSLGVAAPNLLFGADSKQKIKLGLVGCGGRGKWIAELFEKHGGYEIAAVADYFQDQADAAGSRFKVPESRRFTGLSSYKRLIDAKVDAVAIESPPYFHPEQAAAAVDAGCHVYMAKPIAVDVPGCQSVEQSAKRAAEKNLVYLVDFQTRTHPLLKDFAGRIRAGEIGAIVCAEANYQTGPVGETRDGGRRADPKNNEYKLRAWVTDRVLSGDVITEQNIHSLDMACWFLDAAPVKAWGKGGKRRNFIGDCWDNFSVVFEYPGGVNLTFNSKQVGFGYDDIMCRVYGMNGTVDAHYSGNVSFQAREHRASGDVGDLYRSGAEANIASFYESVMSKDYSNTTVAPSVRSNLTTILGRTAAYTRKEVTWDEMMRSAERLTTDLSGLKA